MPRVRAIKADVVASEVPFFDYSALWRDRGAALLSAIDDVGRRGAFILQSEVREFENRLSDLLGVGTVIGVGNCTDGLELLLRAAGIGTGDEVIMPSHTFVATAGAVRNVGATPRFAEVGRSRDLDLDDLERVATSATKCVIPVSLNGRCTDLPAVKAVADAHGWVLIEDAAQAVGARINGRAAGTFGFGGAFSFYPAKTLAAPGDAGAIVTTSEKVAEVVGQLRDHGRTDAGVVKRWGRNSRLDNLHAAVLLVQLQHYQEDITRRREIFARYLDALRATPGMVLPSLDGGDRYDVCQNFEVEAEQRDELRAALSERGIGTALPWGGTTVSAIEGLGIDGATPETDALMAKLLLLPLHAFMTDEQVDAVIDAVQWCLGS